MKAIAERIIEELAEEDDNSEAPTGDTGANNKSGRADTDAEREGPMEGQASGGEAAVEPLSLESATPKSGEDLTVTDGVVSGSTTEDQRDIHQVPGDENAGRAEEVSPAGLTPEIPEKGGDERRAVDAKKQSTTHETTQSKRPRRKRKAQDEEDAAVRTRRREQSRQHAIVERRSRGETPSCA
ncbi:hypothetical protein DVH05_011879 [Phytophthora capsici]|nr:hypothetical protein DVH05_014541 [Phytophthora capsici]KAG1684101.1 hypothetical protein DVH05_011879 [Phytophthora capsici]